ncbi:hypothetical protein [Thioalkalivibrio sp. ALJ24]|uniref:hypothetical protein n=1 Tax=Thioalkalivibrio sp. ALJ24 TaxID=545276 RepID=UPI00036DBFEF
MHSGRIRNAGRGLAAVLAGMVLLAGCGGETTSQVTLDQLAGAAADFDGEMVEVTGRVETFEDPRHYWIEDDPQNRVAISPEQTVADRVGEEVRLVGRFSYSPEDGRSLEVDEEATAAANAGL